MYPASASSQTHVSDEALVANFVAVALNDIFYDFQVQRECLPARVPPVSAVDSGKKTGVAHALPNRYFDDGSSV